MNREAEIHGAVGGEDDCPSVSLDLIDAVAQLWLDEAHRWADLEHWDLALRSAHLAARARATQNRTLAWPALEAFLREISKGVLKDIDPPTTPPWPFSCVHVLSEALPAGGLTAMAQRWIDLDMAHGVHHVILLDTSLGVPRELAQSVQSRRGQIHCAPPACGPVALAQWVRDLTHRLATHVVLHVDPADVTCAVAFGKPGGPPVLLVNHTAHAFWVGVTTSDLILNCRGSHLEAQWTRDHRGAMHQACVPIPLGVPRLTDHNGLATTQSLAMQLARQRARAAWGLGIDQVVLLTVGSAFKYAPSTAGDFLHIFEQILHEAPHAVLLAVGFDGDARWHRAAQATQGRIRTLGTLPQAALRQLHSGCDLYVEGFPFGTTTALLEASAAGMPVVLAPQFCPPPYGTDGLVIDGVITRDQDLQAYKTTCMQLIGNEALRHRRAESLTPKVLEHHTGLGWQRHLDVALLATPTDHEVRHGLVIRPIPEAAYAYWAQRSTQWSPPAERILERSLLWALHDGVPLPTWSDLCRLCQGHARARRIQGLIPWMLQVWRQACVPWLPPSWSASSLRLAMWIPRSGDGWQRLKHRVSRGLRTSSPGAYEEYRAWGRRSNMTWHMPESLNKRLTSPGEPS